MPGVEETAVSFARACEAAGVRYAFVGGIAVAAWGQPRATQDVDALLILDAAAVAPLVEALRAQGLDASAADFHDALGDRSHVTIFDPRSLFHVDAKLVESREEEAEIEAAVAVDLGTGVLRIVRPEDAIAFKLHYGSPLDLQDARAMVQRQGRSLDLERLRAVAARLNVLEALEELLRELP